MLVVFRMWVDFPGGKPPKLNRAGRRLAQREHREHARRWLAQPASGTRRIA
jgi:hypothetical protein